MVVFRSQTKKMRKTLLFRMVVGMVIVSLLAIVAASVMLYFEFKDTNTEFRAGTLRTQARPVLRALRSNPPEARFRLPDNVLTEIQANGGRLAVVNEKGEFLAGTPNVSRALTQVSHTRPRELFMADTANAQTTQYGISIKVRDLEPPTWVQISFPSGELIFDSVIENFVSDIAWIWIPFVLLLLIVNILIARLALRPLSFAAREAQKIGPLNVSMRIPDVGLPKEVELLVQAVNQALDRLQEGYRTQEDFVSDAAHELRTPLAVIKAHLAFLHGEESATLRDEVIAMERLVNQLLDRARVGGMRLDLNDIADLSEIATNVATYLAPIVIQKGRSIEVRGAERPVKVPGSYDYLFRALRNLVENAVDHAPAGTTVIIATDDEPSVTVLDQGPGIPAEQRTHIFQRFWQGKRDRSVGAGLGLAIVETTIRGHGGHMEVTEAPGGGAAFVMHFPPRLSATAG